MMSPEKGSCEKKSQGLVRDLYICDNLPVLRGLKTDSVDLVYLDPPFNSMKPYRAPIGTPAEGQMFDDTWRWDELDTAWLGEIDRRCPALARVIDAVEATRGEGDAAYTIMMGVRLIQLRRVLKPQGSIYLHCDDTAVHLLRMSMDAVFKKTAFKNQIVWRRYSSHNDTGKWGRVCDRILYYGGSKRAWNPPRLPLEQEAIERDYRYEDSTGRFTTSPLQARTLSGGGYSYEWRGIKDVWKFPKERLEEMDALGMIYWPPRGKVPRRKVYYDVEKSGRVLSDLMDDIPRVSGKESTGWRTQKPLALLRRLIKASSHPGDVVLDPFCGCATTCVAAEIEERQWIGIDACKAAEKITKMTLSKNISDWDDTLLSVYQKAPERVDVEITSAEAKNDCSAENIDRLYGNQRGYCSGCGGHYRVKDFHVDHMIPRSEGGGDDLANLQLFCGHCNATKSVGSMKDLWKRLVEGGVLRKSEAEKLQGKWEKKQSMYRASSSL